MLYLSKAFDGGLELLEKYLGRINLKVKNIFENVSLHPSKIISTLMFLLGTPGATSKTCTRNLDPDPEKLLKPKPGLSTRTLKRMNPEKHGINMGLKICLTLESYIL